MFNNFHNYKGERKTVMTLPVRAWDKITPSLTFLSLTSFQSDGNQALFATFFFFPEHFQVLLLIILILFHLHFKHTVERLENNETCK